MNCNKIKTYYNLRCRRLEHTHLGYKGVKSANADLFLLGVKCSFYFTTFSKSGKN
jgi:hypothetical protein